jgi:hypothetical protein
MNFIERIICDIWRLVINHPGFVLLNVAVCRVCCPTNQTATLRHQHGRHALVGHERQTQQQCRTAHVVDVCTRQRVEIEFLTAEGSSVLEIDRCLGSMFG